MEDNILKNQGKNTAPQLYELPSGKLITWINANEAELLIDEIYNDNIYLKHQISIPKNACVFNVGTNIGVFSFFASEAGKNVEVHAFEPVLEVCDVLRENAERNSCQFHICNQAIADKQGKIDFAYYRNSSLPSGGYADAEHEKILLKQAAINQQKKAVQEPHMDSPLQDLLINSKLVAKEIKLEATTISCVIRLKNIQKIDLLKIDIEKSDSDAVMGITAEDWKIINQVVVEVDSIEQKGFILNLLNKVGFTCMVEHYGMLPGTDVFMIYAKKPF